MKLLLDTNALIWAMTASRSLPADVQRLIEDARNDVFFSAVNIFEIAVKRAAGRRTAPSIGAAQAALAAGAAGYGFLPVSVEHAVAVETIAQFHPDPFDRLLLAQAQVESMRLVSHDEDLASYDSRTILF